MAFYVVCTSCTFLRVYGQRAHAEVLEECPSCRAEVVVREGSARFEPAYLWRATRSLREHPAVRD